MKKVLIIVGILIAVVFLSLTLISTLNPQGLADFFMNIAASDFNVEIGGERHDVKLKNLGEGVTSDDRLFVMQKMVVLYIMAEEEDRITPEIIEGYNKMILAAAEDEELSKVEVEQFENYHSDLVSKEQVRKWIKVAEEYEESAKELAKGKADKE